MQGSIVLTPEKAGVRLTGNITGLTPGKHGVHVHWFGDFIDGCTSAGEHWNPKMSVHGGPKAPPRHPVCVILWGRFILLYWHLVTVPDPVC